MKRPFLVIAIVCLVLFVVAGLVVGELLPYFGQGAQRRARRLAAQGPSLWTIVQNISAVLGIVAFFIQIVQWGRRR
jgi:hypothetical protein